MMKKNLFLKLILMISVLTTMDCAGLRFSESAPEAKGFHPQTIAVFPVEIWNSEENKVVKAATENMIAGELVKKKWFKRVVDKETMNSKQLADEELNKAMKGYLAKLQALKFSDPDLSQKIGELAGVDAFLMVSIDEWSYAVERGENIAKVGMTMKLYEASTGNLIWKAGHDVKEDYIMIKPDLTKLALDVIHKMITYMPH